MMIISSLSTYNNVTIEKSNPRGQNKIVRITPHAYIGQVTAKQGVDYLKNTERHASVNYVIGCDGSIGCNVPEERRAWTSGSSQDYTAITIELACDKTEPYAITTACYNSLVKLCVDICKRNNIKDLHFNGNKADALNLDKNNVTLHKWFQNTGCPHTDIERRIPSLCADVNKQLSPQPKPQPQAPQEAKKLFYRVQVGAYKNKQSGNATKSKLTKNGFDSFYTFEDGLFKLICGSFSSESFAKKRSEELKQLQIANFIKKVYI